MINSETLLSKLSALYEAKNLAFNDLVKAADLDPRRDFVNRDLRALRFVNSDLSGFNFSGSDLRGTGLRFANVYPSTLLDRAILDENDSYWYEHLAYDQFNGLPKDLLVDIRKALQGDNFELVYQPIFNLTTKQASRVEALVRWQHPEHGWISPATFIPVIEEAHLVDELTYAVLERAVKDHRYLKSKGSSIPISVNYPGSLLSDDDFVKNCLRILHGSASDFRLEITEFLSVILDDDMARNINLLKNANVTLAIDGFGTGFSNIKILERIGAVELKIDRSLLISSMGKEDSTDLLQPIVDIGKRLGMSITAEGIDSPEQITKLLDIGVDDAQGYIFGRPLDIHQLTMRVMNEPGYFVGIFSDGEVWRDSPF